MKLKHLYVLIALLGLGVLGVTSFQKLRKTNASGSHAAARPSVAEFELNDAEIKNLMDQVEVGDADAAYRLALYYEMLRLDHSKGEHWLTQAAALGHAGAKKWLDDIADRRRRFTPENMKGSK